MTDGLTDDQTTELRITIRFPLTKATSKQSNRHIHIRRTFFTQQGGQAKYNQKLPQKVSAE